MDIGELEEMLTETSTGGDAVDNGDAPLNTSDLGNCTNTYCLSDADYMEFIEAYIFPSGFEWFLIVLSSIIFFVGTVGNILVIMSVIRNPSMRSVTNHFIVNLSLADFLVLIICLPPTILWDVTETWFLGSLMCRAVLFCQRVCVSVSVLTFFCIAVDRWYAIVCPLKFASTANRAKIAVLMTWLVAILVSLPELVYLDTKPSFLQTTAPTIYFTQCVAHWNDTQETAYQIFVLYAFYVVPICTMIGLYGQIVYTLWWRALPPGASGGPSTLIRQGSASHVRGQTCNGNGHAMGNGSNHSPTLYGNQQATTTRLMDQQIRSRRRVAMMLIITVGLFAFCYLPVHTLNILRSTWGLPNTPVWILLSLIVHDSCYMQNATNPIIYYVMSEKFRREFNRIFKCCVGPACRRAAGRRTMRRNSSEVFQCRPPGPTYYHTLNPLIRVSSGDVCATPQNVIVQL
ncbi:Orexin receptor type 2 [Hypsibius exemplaris]|uniref:Orexin receptor type 2 n=1 Tax=Hypsibius exemplaris TaxID=2072580 RepID=A0A1W0WY80_HYPEX|nr:Orexin receptor type 2 [Hypsibius exemplaris]